MINFGAVPAGSVLPVMFTTYAGATGASVTMTGLAVTDIEIYKGTSMTQRASDAGYVLLDTDGIDIDSVTGLHGFSIDTGDNTDAGFYAAGSFYNVVVSAVTVDSQTVTFLAATFRIVAAESVAGTPKADTSHFGGTAGTFAAGRPEVNTTHLAGQAVTAAAGVTFPTSVASPTNITAGTITTATNVTTVNGLAAGVITAASIAADAITAAKIADGAIDAATFADDTGLKSIRSNTAQAGAATTITLDASASAVTDFYKNALIVLTGGTGAGQGRYITAYNGTTKVATVATWATNPDVTSTFAILAADAIVGATAPTASQVADEVQTRTIAAVTVVNGLAANVITAAATAADFTTEVTATVNTKLDTIDDFLDTEIAAIKAKTDNLPAAPAAVGDIPTAIQNADALLDRNMATGTDSGSPTVRTVRQALYALRNKWGNAAGTYTVYKTDDITVSWTSAITTTVGADPITSSDPAS